MNEIQAKAANSTDTSTGRSTDTAFSAKPFNDDEVNFLLQKALRECVQDV